MLKYLHHLLEVLFNIFEKSWYFPSHRSQWVVEIKEPLASILICNCTAELVSCKVWVNGNIFQIFSVHFGSPLDWNRDISDLFADPVCSPSLNLNTFFFVCAQVFPNKWRHCARTPSGIVNIWPANSQVLYGLGLEEEVPIGSYRHTIGFIGSDFVSQVLAERDPANAVLETSTITAWRVRRASFLGPSAHLHVNFPLSPINNFQGGSAELRTSSAIRATWAP